MKFNFRTKLIFTLTPLMLLIMMGIVFNAYRIASRSILHEQDQHLAATVQQALRELEQWVADRESQAEFLSGDPGFETACAGRQLDDAKARLATFHQLHPVYENVFLADTNGTIFLDSIAGKSVGIEVGKLPAYAINVQKALAGEAWVGDAQQSPATGRPVVLITAPITDEQHRVVGMVGTPVELNAFSTAFLRDITIGKSGYVAITDRSGLTLAHKDLDFILKVNISKYRLWQNDPGPTQWAQ